MQFYFHWICSAMVVNAAAIHVCKERLQLVPEWDLGGVVQCAELHCSPAYRNIMSLLPCH